MKGTIIGTFTGKCCDAEVYNNNGMLLNRDLFNNLINSEDYKTAMKNRYYIGFLGHPEDPNCMNFQEACIVMTSMEMHENGEIWGTFDLIDTPVGRIVKTFIDAGVTFGISIRGAGDVDGTGKVDPDTFVFRGYDLVTFPAYDDAVPEFKAIAASSDIKKQKQFKKICAAIMADLPSVESEPALEIIQSQFAEGSQEYNQVGDRIDEINQATESENCSLLQQKLDAMTSLYLQAVQENQKLFDEIQVLKIEAVRCSSESSRKIRSIERIMGSQVSRLEAALTAAENRYKTAVSANSRLKDENQKYVRSCDELEGRLQEVQDEMLSLEQRNSHLDRVSSSIRASSDRDIKSMEKKLRESQSALEEVSASNLIYQREVESTTQQLEDAQKVIASLKSQLSETVTANKRLDRNSSNRDEEVRKLNAEVVACRQLVEEYQQAYADMCASAVGIGVDNIPITSKTSPSELRSYIFGSTSASGVPARLSYEEPEELERIDDEYCDGDSGLVSL